jgi:hypothetical protein
VALLNLRRRITRLVVLTGVVSLGVAEAQNVDEYQVKAAFLYNFAKFVEWPAHALKSSDDPLVICVIGRSPFGSLLEQAVSGKQIEGRPLVVREISEAHDALACQILFVAAGEKKRVPAILDQLKSGHVLTVGDIQNFAAAGGMINFKLEAGRVRIEVNVEAAERANLRISSKLLSLATIVKDPKE